MTQVADPVDRRVSTVGWLLIVCVVASFADALAAAVHLVGISGAEEAVVNAANGTGQDGAQLVANARFSAMFNAIVAAFAVVALVWLTFALRRRVRRSRAGFWFTAAALVALLLFGAASDSGNDAGSTAGASETLRKALEQLQPAWYSPTHSLLAGVTLIGIVAAAIMMARISSIDFYR